MVPALQWELPWLQEPSLVVEIRRSYLLDHYLVLFPPQSLPVELSWVPRHHSAPRHLYCQKFHSLWARHCCASSLPGCLTLDVPPVMWGDFRAFNLGTARGFTIPCPFPPKLNTHSHKENQENIYTQEKSAECIRTKIIKRMHMHVRTNTSCTSLPPSLTLHELQCGLQGPLPLPCQEVKTRTFELRATTGLEGRFLGAAAFAAIFSGKK